MNTLDWRDTLVVVAVLAAAILAERTYGAVLFAVERRRTCATLADVVHGPIALIETDHVPCSNCGTTICFCSRKGQALYASAVECLGTINVGCLHLTQPDTYCAECRASCAECRAEDHVDAAVAYLRDDAAIRSLR